MTDLKKLAAAIWKKLETDLEDRGCFNGIDAAVMRELRAAQRAMIVEELEDELKKKGGITSWC